MRGARGRCASDERGGLLGLPLLGGVRGARGRGASEGGRLLGLTLLGEVRGARGRCASDERGGLLGLPLLGGVRGARGPGASEGGRLLELPLLRGLSEVGGRGAIQRRLQGGTCKGARCTNERKGQRLAVLGRKFSAARGGRSLEFA